MGGIEGRCIEKSGLSWGSGSGVRKMRVEAVGVEQLELGLKIF